MSLTLITTATISDLATIPGNASNAVLVTDINRGGVFNYVASGLTVNNGTIFATSTTGFWIRQISEGEGLNVQWFGAIPDYTTPGSSTDNKTAIENTVAALQVGQEIMIPQGSYYISSLVLNLPNNCKYTQKGILYSDSATIAVLVGPAAANGIGYDISGLSVLFTSSSIVSGNIGVKIQNLYSSQVEIKEAYGFDTGVLIYGDAFGNVYNKYYLGFLHDNHTSLQLDHASSGWVNENMFYGGHFAFTSLFSGAVAHLVIKDPVSNPINNNRFLFPSFESGVSSPLPKAASLGGEFNYVLYPRYEFNGSTATTVAFELTSASQYNEITCGFSWESTQISNLGSHNNWRSRDFIMQSGGTAATPLLTLQSYNTSSAKIIDILNSASSETFYVLGTGQLSSSSFGSFGQGVKLGTSAQALLYAGSGTPQGHITADPGSAYFSTSGGNGTSIYIKESGTGTTTGWVPYASPPANGVLSSNGGSATYNIPHGLSSTPSFFTATPTSHDAAGNYYITANATNIIVNYLSATPSGTGNITFIWQAKV